MTKAAAAERDRPSVGWWIATGLLIAVAALLRGVGIGAEELWVDEALSLHFATVPDWIGLNRSSSNPPLYYLLLRLWVPLAGESEAGVRALSAVLATGAVGVAAWAAYELFGQRVALWCSAIVALAPMQIYYGQEARTYALLTLTLFASVAALARATRTGSATAWIGFAAAASLSLYSHYLAAFALLPTALLLVLEPDAERARRAWRPFLVSAAAASLVFLPWMLASFLGSDASLRRLDWIRQAWEATPPAFAVPKSLAVFAIGSHEGLSPIFLKQLSGLPYGTLWQGFAVAVLVVLGLVVIRRRGEGRIAPPGTSKHALRRVRAHRRFVLLLLLVPLVLLWLTSWGKPLYVVGRYDVVAYPGFALALALGFEKLRVGPRLGVLWATAATLALLLPISVKLQAYYAAAGAGNGLSDRAAAAALEQGLRPGEPVVLMGEPFAPFLYYLKRRGYRCQSGECRRDTPPRHFPLLLFGPGAPPLPAWKGLGSVIAVFRPYKFEDGKSWFTEEGHRLIRELGERGFRGPPESVSEQPSGVLRIRRR